MLHRSKLGSNTAEVLSEMSLVTYGHKLASRHDWSFIYTPMKEACLQQGVLQAKTKMHWQSILGKSDLYYTFYKPEYSVPASGEGKL